MPETCLDSVDNKHLIVASCWFSLSLSLHIFNVFTEERNLSIKFLIPLITGHILT